MSRDFTVIDVPQRSPEWFKVRLGRLTGSRAAEMMSTRRDGKEAADRRNLRMELVLERMTGKPQERAFQSQAMLDGQERELDACGLYEAETGRVVERTGFLSHNRLMAGCSLDGHVGDFAGIIECKCPLAATHLSYLRSGFVPEEYIWQIRHALWITGAAWADFLSFHPDFPEPLRTKLVRVNRDEKEMTTYALAVDLFLKEVERETEEVGGMVAF